MPAGLVLDGNHHIEPANPRFGRAARAGPEQINDLGLMLLNYIDDRFGRRFGSLERQAVPLDCDLDSDGGGLLDDLGRGHTVPLHGSPVVSARFAALSADSPAETFSPAPAFPSGVG